MLGDLTIDRPSVSADVVHRRGEHRLAVGVAAADVRAVATTRYSRRRAAPAAGRRDVLRLPLDRAGRRPRRLRRHRVPVRRRGRDHLPHAHDGRVPRRHLAAGADGRGRVRRARAVEPAGRGADGARGVARGPAPPGTSSAPGDRGCSSAGAATARRCRPASASGSTPARRSCRPRPSPAPPTSRSAAAAACRSRPAPAAPASTRRWPGSRSASPTWCGSACWCAIATSAARSTTRPARWRRPAPPPARSRPGSTTRWRRGSTARPPPSSACGSATRGRGWSATGRGRPIRSRASRSARRGCSTTGSTPPTPTPAARCPTISRTGSSPSWRCAVGGGASPSTAASARPRPRAARGRRGWASIRPSRCRAARSVACRR